MSNGEAAPVSPPEIVREINAVPDPILVAIVESVAESDDYQVGLTLNVCGLVVSGTLISGSRFFDELAEQLREQGHKGLAEDFAVPTAEMIREEVTAAGERFEPAFIHMRAARVFSSGSDRPLPEMLWRGRLSHVSAWSIGTIG